MKIGKIVNVKKHPDADSLYVEEGMWGLKHFLPLFYQCLDPLIARLDWKALCLVFLKVERWYICSTQTPEWFVATAKLWVLGAGCFTSTFHSQSNIYPPFVVYPPIDSTTILFAIVNQKVCCSGSETVAALLVAWACLLVNSEEFRGICHLQTCAGV